MAKSYGAFVAMLWQQFDNLLLGYNQQPLSDGELAHLAGLAHLDSQAFYQKYGYSSEQYLHLLSKKMLEALISYRLKREPDYECPPDFDHLR